MDDTDPCPHKVLRIRPMRESDLDFADSLRSMAGWNQTPSDWHRFLTYEPDGCFVGEWDMKPVATVTTTSYGTELGWVGMMLVHPGYRGRGVASALMNRALEALRGRHIRCVKLDATPLGEPVYARLGFEPEVELHRWERGGGRATVTNRGSVDGLPWGLDRDAFGADRSDWLRRLADDALFEGASDGFGFLRPGSKADYLGPVVARDGGVASRIVGRLLAASSNRFYWDIPDQNTAAVDLAASLGFRPIRPLRRMRTGGSTVTADYRLQFGIGDPATG